MTVYERERQARIAANQARLKELGVVEACNSLAPRVPQPQQCQAPQRKRRDDAPQEERSVRRSGRVAGKPAEFYDEDNLYRSLGIDRLDAFSRRGTRCTAPDPERLAALRAGRGGAVGGAPDHPADGARPAAPRVDSGRGVRVQGGRVYDSRYGVTCHWCRQKTLEEHVQCTAPGCGGGRRLPVSFCTMCLLNRHGESMAQALASEAWVCPPCRGGCGPGCAACCNCGPCRRAAGLAPTHQLVGAARAAGFGDVHDYLVHRATGETAQAISARKRAHAWGAWLAAPHAPAAERDSEAADGGEAATCDALVALEDGSLEPVCTPPEQEAAPPAMRRPKGGSGKLTSLFVATKGALEQLPAMGKEGPALSRKERMLQRMGLSRA
ncbi:CGL62 [Auxenochlorella protothecoides x Auxenochlorella symbiontica]